MLKSLQDEMCFLWWLQPVDHKSCIVLRSAELWELSKSEDSWTCPKLYSKQNMCFVSFPLKNSFWIVNLTRLQFNAGSSNFRSVRKDTIYFRTTKPICTLPRLSRMSWHLFLNNTLCVMPMIVLYYCDTRIEFTKDESFANGTCFAFCTFHVVVHR